MEKLVKPAILVVDMLNDFVTGALTCERGRAIVPATAKLLDAARAAGVPCSTETPLQRILPDRSGHTSQGTGSEDSSHDGAAYPHVRKAYFSRRLLPGL